MTRTGYFIFLASLAMAQGPAFEVAAIKTTTPVELDAIKKSGRSSLFPEQGISISGNRVQVRGLTVATLIRAAYQLRDSQLSGGPGWIANQAYDIAATSDKASKPSFNLVRQMLQTLLADRFQLKFHRETQEGAAYALTVSKSGPKLKASVVPEYSTHVTAGASQIRMTISKATMAQFCGRLATFVDRPVTDTTNLEGVFDMNLLFAPVAMDEAGNSKPRELPSIFTALQQQLGLKLEASKAPVEMLIVDQVARPSAN